MQAVTALYEAAADPGAWPAALAAMARHCGAGAAQFLVWDKSSNGVGFSAVSGLDRRAESLYAAYYGAMDPRRRLIGAARVGEIVACHEHFDEAFVSRSEFYSDFLLRWGGRYLAGVQLIDSPRQAVFVGVHRDMRRGPFSLATRAGSRSCCRTCSGRRRCTGTWRHGARRRDGPGDARGLALALLVLGADGRVRLINPAAEALLARDDGLALRHGRLVAEEPEAASLLRRYMAAAVASAGGDIEAARGVTPAPSRCRADRAAVPISSSSCARRAVGPHRSRRLGWSRSSIPSPAAGTGHVLRQVFGLTPAEIKLAGLLLQGKRVEEIADERAVWLSTVRSQLKALFAKTGTARQGE
jgi:DNA-binding CsgD family transcriptional regulator